MTSALFLSLKTCLSIIVGENYIRPSNCRDALHSYLLSTLKPYVWGGGLTAQDHLIIMIYLYINS